MRQITIVRTEGNPGYYTTEDLVLQLIMYGDITPWRTARMMAIAEECREDRRAVLVLTENDHVEHLAAVGFVVYRPSVIGLNPQVDAAVIATQLRAGLSVVVNTNHIGQTEKNELTRAITNELSGMGLGNLGLVVESAESFFPRRRSRGDTAGMDAMNNLLKRAKAEGACVAFAAESPEEVAVEISRSCGTPVVGCITNEKRVKAVSDIVDRRIARNSDELWGVKALNPNNFYLFNRFTAPRQGDGQQDLPLEIVTTLQSLSQMQFVPRWLRDRELACGFDPNRPTRRPDLDGDAQRQFEEDVETARAEADAEAGDTSIAAQRTAAPAVAVGVPRGANDNPRAAARPDRRKATRSRSRFVGAQTAVAMVRTAGIQNADRLVAIGLRVVNARGGRLNAPLHGRLTPRSLANRIIDEPLLREAVLAGFAIAHRTRQDKETVISAGACAAALHQALVQDVALARRFHSEMFVEGVRSGRRSRKACDLDTALRQLGTEDDAARRSEAQYQLLVSAWAQYARNAATPLPAAA